MAKISAWVVVESNERGVIGATAFTGRDEALEHLSCIVRENCDLPRYEKEDAVRAAYIAEEYQDGDYNASLVYTGVCKKS